MDIISIAIDGPAGAGKSTTAQALADKLGILHLDTGAMYRAAALACIRANVDKNDRDALIAAASKAKIEIEFREGEQQTLLDGENVNGLIRTAEVSLWASDVSAIPEIRLKLVEIQRDLSHKISMVVDGRDITTYVLPDAPIKIYLDASVSKRAERRYKELLARGEKVELADVINDQKYRDAQDMNREFAPLKIAEDALYIDTTEQTIDDTVEEILAYMRTRKFLV